MAASNDLTGLVTIETSFYFGGPSGKKRKMVTATFVDAANGITVGGTTNTILASAFGMTKVESCSNIMVYTTATGASVRIIPAAAAYDGLTINTIEVENGTDAQRSDVADSTANTTTLATTESGRITLVGY